MHNLCLFAFCVVSAITSSFAGGDFSPTDSDLNPVMSMMAACGPNITNCEEINKRQVQRDTTPVSNTWILPFAAVVLVGRDCTGVVIGPKKIVVLGYCVHPTVPTSGTPAAVNWVGGGGKGYYRTEINPSFMYRDSLEVGVPVKQETLTWKGVVAAKGWLDSRQKKPGFALIFVEHSVPHVEIEWNARWHLAREKEMDVIGFRQNGDKETMWKTTGTITDIRTDSFDLEVDNMMMGSGVFLRGSKKLCGIITGHSKRVLTFNSDDPIKDWTIDSPEVVLNPNHNPHV